MESLKRALPLTEGMHCLHAAEIEEPLMFQISPRLLIVIITNLFTLRFVLT